MNKKSAQTVGTALDQLLKNLGIDRRVHEQRVVLEFEKAMGVEFCKRARAVKIENGILFLEVINSVWRQELFYQKETIRQRLNAYFGDYTIKEIIFR